MTNQIYELEKKIFGATAYSEIEIDEMSCNSNYIIKKIVVNEKLIGYVISFLSVDVCDIMKIAVDEEYRHLGYGKKLLELLKSSVDTNIMLEVRVSNVAAIKFYEKNGFKIISTRKKYYSDNGEDAYVMLYERS